MKLVIRGSADYVERLAKHLRKEHPSTIGRMDIEMGNIQIKQGDTLKLSKMFK